MKKNSKILGIAEIIFGISILLWNLVIKVSLNDWISSKSIKAILAGDKEYGNNLKMMYENIGNITNIVFFMLLLIIVVFVIVKDINKGKKGFFKNMKTSSYGIYFAFIVGLVIGVQNLITAVFAIIAGISYLIEIKKQVEN